MSSTDLWPRESRIAARLLADPCQPRVCTQTPPIPSSSSRRACLIRYVITARNSGKSTKVIGSSVTSLWRSSKNLENGCLTIHSDGAGTCYVHEKFTMYQSAWMSVETFTLARTHSASVSGSPKGVRHASCDKGHLPTRIHVPTSLISGTGAGLDDVRSLIVTCAVWVGCAQ